MNKRAIIGLLFCGSTVLTSCTFEEDNPVTPVESQKSIVILFESDSHCEVSGYPKLAGLRDAINQSDTVTDVMVFDRASGEYKPLDLEKDYQVALGVFYSSVGFYGMLKDCKVIKFEATTTRDALVQYLSQTLNGKLGDDYKSAQGRITIIDD